MVVGETPAVARHRLRFALRAAREEKGLTQRQVATALDWSMAKVNRIEAGEVTVSVTDLQALLRLLDVTDPATIAELTEHARAARRRGWWDELEYRAHLTPANIQSLQFETVATEIRSFLPALIPGSLQTRRYASAIIDGLHTTLSERERQIRVDVRMRRRHQLLHREDPPIHLLLLDESALLRQVGGPEVMSEQLYDLLEVVRAGRVAVRVVPLTEAAVVASYGLFTIYTSDDETALYLEHHIGDEMVYAPEIVSRYRSRFDAMWDRALPPEISTRLIEARAAEMRVTGHLQTPAG